MTQAQQANGRMLDVASAHSPARANRSIGSPIRYRADTLTWAQALLPYPRGFHNEAGDSEWVTPVSSHARAVTLSGPGWVPTVIDHCRQAHRLIAGSRLASAR